MSTRTEFVKNIAKLIVNMLVAAAIFAIPGIIALALTGNEEYLNISLIPAWFASATAVVWWANKHLDF